MSQIKKKRCPKNFQYILTLMLQFISYIHVKVNCSLSLHTVTSFLCLSQTTWLTLMMRMRIIWQPRWRHRGQSAQMHLTFFSIHKISTRIQLRFLNVELFQRKKILNGNVNWLLENVDFLSKRLSEFNQIFFRLILGEADSPGLNVDWNRSWSEHEELGKRFGKKFGLHYLIRKTRAKGSSLNDVLSHAKNIRKRGY